MPFSYLRVSLIALVASAVAVSTAPGLTVKTSIPDVQVDGLQNLKITATITNIGDEILKLLNDPHGVLDTFPEDSFNITGATGLHPSFNGAKIKYSPTYAASLDDEMPGIFTVLVPGASINVTHDLSAAYNFTRPGAGDYSIVPLSLFTYVDVHGTPKDLYATVEDVAVVKLTGNLAVPRVNGKRATFNSCSPIAQSQLNTAAASAQTLAFNAYAYAMAISSGTYWYTRWFGAYDSSRLNTVRSHFELIVGHDFSTFTYDCSCTRSDWFTYIEPNEFGKIWVCPGFWSAPNTGTDSKAGTLIRAAFHWPESGGTVDYAYGQSAALALARKDPSKAVMNTDNHEFFAENNPPQ